MEHLDLVYSLGIKRLTNYINEINPFTAFLTIGPQLVKIGEKRLQLLNTILEAMCNSDYGYSYVEEIAELKSMIALEKSFIAKVLKEIESTKAALDRQEKSGVEDAICRLELLGFEGNLTDY